MPEIIFHPDVVNEIKSSYEWYQDRADGLGEDFLSELESAYQTILELPDTWPKFNPILSQIFTWQIPFFYNLSRKE